MSPDTTPKNTGSIRSILVIDDHPLYRDALASTIETIFSTKKVKTATTLTEGMKLLATRFSPDLVMLDLNLPDVTGLSGFMKIRDKIPDVPILVISAISQDRTISALMAAGAAGFVPKEASQKVLEKALADVREGKKFLPQGYNPTDRKQIDELPIQEVAQKLSELSPQQNKILKLICKGLPNKQIAYEMDLAEATVKAHITALLRRLGVQNRTQAALLVKEASTITSASYFLDRLDPNAGA